MSKDLGPLPEPPAFYRYQYQSHYGPVWRSSAENWNGCPPLASEGLYTADQMRAYAAEQVAAERERCAKVCEDKGPELLRWWGDGQANAACQECATAIRGA